MPSQLLRIQPAPGRAQTRISALSRITCGPGSYILDNLRGVIACSDFKRHHCCTATRLPAHFTAVGNIRATAAVSHHVDQEALQNKGQHLSEPRRVPRTTTCHSLIEDTLPLLLSVDRSVYAALASCFCTLCAVQMTRAWQAPGEISARVAQFDTSRSDMGGQIGGSAQRQPRRLTDAVRKDQGDDSTALQQHGTVDWGNPTEADMWLAAESGVANTPTPSTPHEPGSYRSGAGKVRSWLPQWHLQGLHKQGRKAVIAACMQALRDIIACMPAAAASAPEATFVRATDAIVAVAACNACYTCMGYVPKALLKATFAHIDFLTAPEHDVSGASISSDEARGKENAAEPAASSEALQTTALESAADSEILEHSRSSVEVVAVLAQWLQGSLCCRQCEQREDAQLFMPENSSGSTRNSQNGAERNLHSHSEGSSSSREPTSSSFGETDWGYTSSVVTPEIRRKHSTASDQSRVVIESPGMFRNSENVPGPTQSRGDPAAPGKWKINAWARRMRADISFSPDKSAEEATDQVFPGLATGKGAAHAVMLRCILQLRNGPLCDSQPAAKNGNAYSSATMHAHHAPEASRRASSKFQESDISRDSEASVVDDEGVQRMHVPLPTAEGGHRRQHGIGARDAQLPAQIFQNVPSLLQDMVLCSAEACAAAYMDDVRSGAVPALHRHMRGIPVGVSGADGAETGGVDRGGGWTVQAAKIEVPALLDTRLGTTRELERFRNHLAIAAAVRQNYGRVRDMYEDRYTLQGVRDGHRLFTRQLFIRRTHELNALEGWQARLSTAMELGDVVAPIAVRLLQRLSRLLSWLLVSLVGGGLGLIYKGIRQSMSGSGKRRSSSTGWDFSIGGRNNRRSENDDEMDYSFDFM